MADKIVDNKPADVTNRCTTGAGQDVPAAYCDGVVESYSTPRMAAGMPATDDVLKCQLKPLDRADYDVTFTDAQWAALEAAFPTGVCDYSKPGVSKQDTVGWLTYADGPGGRPLGEPPASVAFGAGGDVARGAGDGELPATGWPGGLAVAAAGLALAAAVGLRGTHRRHRTR